MMRGFNSFVGSATIILTFRLLTFAVLTNGSSIAPEIGSSKLGKALDVKEPIDPNEKYFLGWEIDEGKGEITFEVEVETTGYVGFGVSPSGSMAGADLFIAGVLDNGTWYSGDYFAARNGMPSKDNHSDWNLIDAREDESKTYLKFSRLLNTCDEEDFPITADTNRLIWSIGHTDEIAQHAERGTYSANLLIPEQPFDPEQYDHFDTVVVDMEMKSADTTYWCTIHKGPTFNATQHVVAFEAHLPSVEAQTYTHHFILYNCFAPEGQSPDDVFGEFVGGPGNHCHLRSEEQDLPRQYCLQYIFVWAKGGKRMVFPDEIGYPIGETPGLTQYYMLEIHYDNPDRLAGINFTAGTRTYYTPELRSTEATLLVVGHEVSPSLTVPPITTDFIVTGHCPSQCTKMFFPEEGVNVFNSLLHSHLSGRKLKLRQYRNGEELEWMDNDEHYDFDYQQNKPLTQYKKIFPGDQLTLECTYDSTWNEQNEIIVGGLSSREEMCQAFIWYYPRQKMDTCLSTYPLLQSLADFGITNYTAQSSGGVDTYVILEPENLAGDYVDSLSFKFKWTEEFREEYQQKRRYAKQDFVCVSSDPDAGGAFGRVKYVDAPEYVPIDQCTTKGEGGGSGGVEALSSCSFVLLMTVFSALLLTKAELM